MKKPVTLIIMDGFGLNPAEKGNAIKAANTPNLDELFSKYPCTSIGASGMDVGLPQGQMGNSEVGHTNIGAGRIVYQDLTRITKAIEDGEMQQNKVLNQAMENAKKQDKALHLIGLVSDGGVHSHNTHLYSLMEMAKQKGVKNVYIHALLDGRDVPPTSGVTYLAQLEQKIKEIGIGQIATVMGRYYGMDRDTQWGRVEKAYDAMVQRKGIQATEVISAVEKSYQTIDQDGKHITDEFVIPTVIADPNPARTAGAAVAKNDSVVFFNFRPDRAREITRAFVDPDFNEFERKDEDLSLYYVCMTEYDATMPNVHIAFDTPELSMTMGEVISKSGRTQLRIAETTKYAHVTFFFNGGEEIKFPGEDRVLVPTPDVATFDLKPEMSAYPVCEKVVNRITKPSDTAPQGYDMIILNFANCDMVGHTGIMEAAVSAVETVDECVGDVVRATLSMGGTAIITADHGNADKMMDENGQPFTAHTTFPVPFCVITPDSQPQVKLRQGGRLADISPTMLKIMGLDKPKEMTGESIII